MLHSIVPVVLFVKPASIQMPCHFLEETPSWELGSL